MVWTIKCIVDQSDSFEFMKIENHVAIYATQKLFHKNMNDLLHT